MSETAIFVDGAYLDKLLELNFNMAKIDYAKFVNLLAELTEGSPEVKGVYYYHCPPHVSYSPNDFERSRYNNKMRFFGALKQLDKFHTRLGKLVYRGINQENGKPIFVQKKITTYLACDFLDVVYNTDYNIVLIAGDSEYTPLVEAATNNDCYVALWHGRSKDRNNNMVHKSLHELCSETHEIEESIVQQCLR